MQRRIMLVVLLSSAASGAMAADLESASKALTLDSVPTTAESATTRPESAAAAAEAAKEEDLLKAAQNPVANLISVPFQNNFNLGAGTDGHDNQCIYVLNFQPVIPVELSEDWNLITRTIVPIINQPALAPGMDSAFGLGDINPSFFFSPAKSEGLIWGVGPTFTFPTGTSPELTSGMYSAGICAVALRIDKEWVYGALINQQWSYGGWGPQEFNQLLIQPFVNYNLPDRWYVTTSPVITANWAQASDYENVWTLPVGGGFGKLVHFGRLPVNLQLATYYNLLTPDGGPTWQVRFQFQFLFPKSML